MANVTPITRILVANRGEIARRIMRTARDMGIGTVAVYADADADAPFVREADLAIALVGTTSTETYLDINKVLAAATRSGADAVHPGYGFLSENAAFAQAVIDAGLKWIGPSPDAIAQMGDKLSAKRLMTAAGVPTLPAVEVTAETDIAAAGQEIGYPVLVKASAGGGGRGMRIVQDEAALRDAIDGAKREAAGAFGDDTVFLEKWLDSSRHIEIQILGDTRGNIVHCFERECSIQRRHQKIIEEAPSSAVTPAIRERMGDAAIKAARQLSYCSAGTVEFLLSGNQFYFLEVNARLQVEHPVTEEIIGYDLVREQIRVAEGEALSFTQASLAINGHAIEARLYAEDPERDFLPSPGPVEVWQPSSLAGARFDSGVETGSLVGADFDPMIAKVIVHAPTRREAASRLASVLETTRVQGLTTNREFLVATLRTPAFLAGDTTTDFIERINPPRTRVPPRAELVDACIAAIMEGQALRRAKARVMRTIQSGWRNTLLPLEQISFVYRDEEISLAYRSRRDGRFRLVVDENEHLVRPFACGKGHVDVEIDGRRMAFDVQPLEDRWLIHGRNGDLTLREVPRYPVPGMGEASGGLTAPMPGRVLDTLISNGDSVTKGQLLLVLEAMKMEHRIVAPSDGVVAAVHVSTGDQVANDQLLVSFEDNSADSAD
ncbi:MAG: acetyl/propionyl/methylcrotonyl-CoA carboxylase subunit alpha [Pseudomonadota bacterium]